LLPVLNLYRTGQGSGVTGQVIDAQSIVVVSTAAGTSSAPMRAVSPPMM
jgi:hypothetical protein